MGKSRQRKLQMWRAAALGQLADSDLSAVQGLPPRRIFRFVDQARFADEFCAGEILLSTLGKCRAYEDPSRGDKDEAVHTYTTTHLVQGVTPEFEAKAGMVGVSVRGSIGLTLTNVTGSNRLSDAWVLCCTERYDARLIDEGFGPYCVEIRDSVLLFRLLSEQLQRERAFVNARIARVHYQDRKFVDVATEVAPLGFVKPPDKYAAQREVRMLWPAARPSPEGSLDPVVLRVHMPPGLVRRVL